MKFFLRLLLPVLLLIAAALTPAFALPIEVMGTGASLFVFNLPVRIPAGTTITAITLRVNGIEYGGEASVRVGTGNPLIPLDNAHTQGDRYSRAWGGIGGPIATQTLTVPVTPFTTTTNTLWIYLHFNGTDGFSSGYRVLSYNLLDANGNAILPDSYFEHDDPSTWTPPLNTPEDIATGQWLWHNAGLVSSSLVGAQALNAHCADCHAADGRDLKYFNFSNTSIIVRSQFHGLSKLQGQQIASYIRSLPVPNPGRPWNPPYQPGPGLDSQPVQEWSAGAGLDWVLAQDSDMLPYLFPNGIHEAAVDTHATLNFRELPQASLLPDWNQWLPRIHPLDAPFAATFAASPFYADYFKLDSQLSAAQASATLPAYIATHLHPFLEHWVYADGLNFDKYLRNNFTALPTATPDIAEAAYSAFKWRLVKEWELMQTYGLEDQTLPYFKSYGPSTIPDRLIEPRSWFTQEPFNTSPHAVGIQIDKPATTVGGNVLTTQYFVDGWYHLQQILNPGSGRTSDQSPFDYNYSFGTFAHTAGMTGLPNALWVVAVMTKGGQESNDGRGAGVGGWDPAVVFEINLLLHSNVYQGNAPEWAGLDQGTATAILNAMLDSYNRANAEYAPSALYAISPGYGDATTVITPGLHPTDPNYRFPNKVYDLLNLGAKAGLDPTLLAVTGAWAQTTWPSSQKTYLAVTPQGLQVLTP